MKKIIFILEQKMLNESNEFTFLEKVLSFKTARASGAGGQHVNKTNSKVIGTLNFEDILTELPEYAINSLIETFGDSLTVSSQESRSQHQNKEIVISKFVKILKSHLKQKKDRIDTEVPKSIKIKNLDKKRKHSFKKNQRKSPTIE